MNDWLSVCLCVRLSERERDTDKHIDRRGKERQKASVCFCAKDLWVGVIQPQVVISDELGLSPH